MTTHPQSAWCSYRQRMSIYSALMYHKYLIVSFHICSVGVSGLSAGAEYHLIVSSVNGVSSVSGVRHSSDIIVRTELPGEQRFTVYINALLFLTNSVGYILWVDAKLLPRNQKRDRIGQFSENRVKNRWAADILAGMSSSIDVFGASLQNSSTIFNTWKNHCMPQNKMVAAAIWISSYFRTSFVIDLVSNFI